MPTVTGSLFMTDNAENFSNFAYSYPSKPMRVVESHIEAALSHQGFDSNVTVSTDYSFDSDDYNSTDSNLVDLRDIWRENWLDGHPDASPHFNLLLLNDDEWPNPDGAGGLATRGDKGDGFPRGGVLLDGVATGNHSTTADRYGSSGDSVEGKIRGAVHEIGHSLNMIHKNGLRYNDFPGGLRVTRATPMGCSDDTGWETSCGTNCTQYSTDQWDHYFGDCEASNIKL